MQDPSDGRLVGVEFTLPSGERAKMVDGFAAGQPWYKFLILDGEFAGKEIWCTHDGEHFHYEARVIEDDGEQFNLPTSDVGGNVIKALDGVRFRVGVKP